MNAGEGWVPVTHPYTATEMISEAVIPEEYRGKEVLLVIECKNYLDVGNSVRVNYIHFSSSPMSPAENRVDGINIDDIYDNYDLVAPVLDTPIAFVSDYNGFKNVRGTAASADGIVFERAALADEEYGFANAAVAAKIAIPASYEYFRIYLTGIDKDVVFRIRSVDFGLYAATIVKTVQLSAGEDRVIQIARKQAPSAFSGTVAILLEMFTEEQDAGLTVEKIAFVSAARSTDEATLGYDLEAMQYFETYTVPDTNALTFEAGNNGHWNCLRSIENTNNEALDNSIWLQVNADGTSDAVWNTSVGVRINAQQLNGVRILAGSYGAKNDDGTYKDVMIRVRVYDYTTNSFAFTGDWYNIFDGQENASAAMDWSKFCATTTDFDSEISGDILLMIEISRSLSEWDRVFLHTVELI